MALLASPLPLAPQRFDLLHANFEPLLFFVSFF